MRQETFAPGRVEKDCLRIHFRMIDPDSDLAKMSMRRADGPRSSADALAEPDEVKMGVFR